MVVLEKGTYRGGYTGFPQYGVAVDVRSGDFLAMDVHQLHGNEPIDGDEGSERLSIVSYMREGIVKKCSGEEIVKDEYFRKASMKVARMKERRKAMVDAFCSGLASRPRKPPPQLDPDVHGQNSTQRPSSTTHFSVYTALPELRFWVIAMCP